MKEESKKRMEAAMERFHIGRQIPAFIDLGVKLEVGAIGFLVHVKTKQRQRWCIFQRPSHEGPIPRLFGSCGQVQDRERVCHGIARVTEILPNGRAKIWQLRQDELPAALEQLGYPELSPEIRFAPTSEPAAAAAPLSLTVLEGNPGDLCRRCGYKRVVHQVQSNLGALVANHEFEAVQASDPCAKCGVTHAAHRARHMFVPQFKKTGANHRG